MLGRPDRRTSVDNVMDGAANSSMPPARTCDSISGSPPSWLLAKTDTLSRPAERVAISLAASVRRIDSGWLSGVLTPSLKSNSAAARAGRPRMAAADAPDITPQRLPRGVLRRSWKWTSAAARAARPRMAAADAPDITPKRLRRVIFIDFIVVFLP